MRIKDIMTGGDAVRVIQHGQTFSEAAQLMKQHSVSALPVVDDRSRVVGIVSERDLTERYSKQAAAQGLEPTFNWLSIDPMHTTQNMSVAVQAATSVGQSKIDEVMATDVLTVGEDDDINSLISGMLQRKVNHVPVVSQDGRLAGIVARGDVISALGSQAGSTGSVSLR